MEAVNQLRVWAFEDGVLCSENLVDALHGRHTFLNAIACLGDFLQWLESGVEDGEVEDEGTGVDR